MKFWGWWRRGPRPSPDVDRAPPVRRAQFSRGRPPVLGDRERWIGLLLAWTGHEKPLKGDQAQELSELEGTLARAGPTRWLAFDKAVRSMNLGQSPIAWDLLEEATLRARGQPHASLLAILSMASMGHVRERIASRLYKVDGNPVALIALILRANDWVPQVRCAARESLSASLQSGVSDAWIIALPHLLRLERSHRCHQDDGGAWYLEILDRLREGGMATWGREVLDAIGLKGRRRLVGDLVRHRLAEVDVLESFLRDPDPGVRAAAVLGIRTLESKEERGRMAVLALEDRFHFVRIHALRVKINDDPEGARELLIRELGAPSPGLRSLARHHLASEGLNIVGAIRERVRLDRDQLGRGWIDALGELGTKGDRDLLAPFRHHGPSQRRAAAWRAWAKLDPEASREELHRAFDPGEPRVNRALVQSLFRTREGPCVDRILNHFRSGSWGGPAAFALVRNLVRLPVWDYLACALWVVDRFGSNWRGRNRFGFKWNGRGRFGLRDHCKQLMLEGWRRPSSDEARRILEVAGESEHVPTELLPLIERARAVVDS